MNMRVVVWALIIFVMLLLVALPTVLFLSFSMLPALVVAAGDRVIHSSDVAKPPEAIARDANDDHRGMGRRGHP